MRKAALLIIIAGFVLPALALASSCPGISDEQWRTMEQIARKHVDNGGSKGKAWKEIRIWLEQQEIEFGRDQERCWTRSLGSLFADREAELLRLGQEARQAEFDKLTDLEREWIGQQNAHRLESIALAKRKIKYYKRSGSNRKMWTARLKECLSDDYVRIVDAGSPHGSMGVIRQELARFNTYVPRVFQVVGPGEVLAEFKYAFNRRSWRFWITGIDTSRLRDRDIISSLEGKYVQIGTKSYEGKHVQIETKWGTLRPKSYTSTEGPRTIPHVKVLGIDPKKLAKFYDELPRDVRR